MKNKTRIAFSAAALLASSASFAAAQDVGVNFTDNGATYAGPGLLGEVFTSSGAFGTSSLGAGISLTLAISQPPGNNFDYFTDRGSSGIYAGALETRPGDVETFTLSGLTAGSLYNVAFYAGNFGNSDAHAVTGSVNGTAFNIAGASFDAPAFTANNSAVINGVAAAFDGTITIQTTSSANYTPYNGIGIQAAPEPSTWVSMLGGIGALAGVQALRRRRA